MEANKILSADILDLIFEGKNKDYGAYNLRKTYNSRITRALIITASVAVLAIGGSLLASNLKSNSNKKVKMQEMTSLSKNAKTSVIKVLVFTCLEKTM